MAVVRRVCLGAREFAPGEDYGECIASAKVSLQAH